MNKGRMIYFYSSPRNILLKLPKLFSCKYQNYEAKAAYMITNFMRNLSLFLWNVELSVIQVADQLVVANFNKI